MITGCSVTPTWESMQFRGQPEGHRCRTARDYFALVDLNTPDFRHRWELEHQLAASHAAMESFTVPGRCQPCHQPVEFAVQFIAPWTAPDGTVIPNWRESLVCPRCEMNARQRMVAQVLQDMCGASEARAWGRPTAAVYIMEQRTPLYRWFTRTLPSLTIVGSEYLPVGDRSGEARNLRHEDAEHLTFDDGMFDLVVSCDVLEHLDQPASALREMARVLRPGGKAILTFPMDPHLPTTVRRARRREDGVDHLLPAVHHLDPCSDEGILVYNDFGWDVLDDMRAAELRDPALHLYWSDLYGYLGIQFYFTAERS
jgi:Methyltransferase domain